MRYLLAYSLMTLALVVPAVADEATVEWDPVDDERVTGYLVTYSSGGSEQELVVVGTRATLADLSDCEPFSVFVRTSAAAGALLGPPSEPLTGLPDPEVFSVEVTETGLVQINGDNFDGDVQVTLDGQVVEATRIDCRTLTVPATAFIGLAVRNVGDGVGETFSLPLPTVTVRRVDPVAP